MSVELVDLQHLFPYALGRIYFFLFAHVPCILKLEPIKDGEILQRTLNSTCF